MLQVMNVGTKTFQNMHLSVILVMWVEWSGSISQTFDMKQYLTSYVYDPTNTETETNREI